MCFLDTFDVAARPIAVQELIPRNPGSGKMDLFLRRYKSPSSPNAIRLCLTSDLSIVVEPIVCSPTSSVDGWHEITETPTLIGTITFDSATVKDQILSDLRKNPSLEEAKEAENDPWKWAEGKVKHLNGPGRVWLNINASWMV
ncbi:hypothetical protein F5880DRAFT_1505277 [Lentinula raphanica]|nr:hypothetical protein F5880DRAFT_1505277 [Lentinula raphanica]